MLRVLKRSLAAPLCDGQLPDVNHEIGFDAEISIEVRIVDALRKLLMGQGFGTCRKLFGGSAFLWLP